MIRTPLRPLARILQARQKGENPDSIERENLRLRHEEIRDKTRARAEVRLLFLSLGFLAAFSTIGARMGLLAATEPVEPRSASAGAEILAQRADITDRNGRILATNMQTYALYAQPKDMVDPGRVSRELAQIFPEIDPVAMERRHGTVRLRVVRDAPLLEPLLPLFFFPLLLPFALFASRGKIEAARWAESDHG